jgi:PadR family transcriptional regulator AphA
MIPLGYALLGLLARRARSGYDLGQLLKEPIGFFWHAFPGQIYPELARLEAAGLVIHERVEQEDRPDKKVFMITEDGRAALREWVTTPVHRAPDRDELMLKAFSAWLVDPTQAAPFFRRQEAYHLQRLAVYEAEVAELKLTGAAKLQQVQTPEFASYATLQRGLDYERSYAAWCRWMAETLEQAAEPPKEPGPPDS